MLSSNVVAKLIDVPKSRSDGRKRRSVVLKPQRVKLEGGQTFAEGCRCDTVAGRMVTLLARRDRAVWRHRRRC